MNRIMIFFPYISFKLKINTSKSEFLCNLKQRIEMRNVLYLPKGKQALNIYNGTISDDSFRISRVTSYGYSAFLPLIKGKVINENRDNLRVSLIVHFSKLVNIIIFFFAIFFIINVVSIVNGFSEPNSKIILINKAIKDINGDNYDLVKSTTIDDVLFVVLSFVLFYATIILLFNYEYNKLKLDFHSLFPPPPPAPASL